jgi:hypothetical protein
MSDIDHNIMDYNYDSFDMVFQLLIAVVDYNLVVVVEQLQLLYLDHNMHFVVVVVVLLVDWLYFKNKFKNFKSIRINFNLTKC